MITDRDKSRARSIAFKAIEKGTLVRGRCEQECRGQIEAHHDDYSEPLDVRWLCKRHHLRFHKDHPELAGRASVQAKNDGKTVTVTINLSNELGKAVLARARVEGRTAAHMVAWILEEGLGIR